MKSFPIVVRLVACRKFTATKNPMREDPRTLFGRRLAQIRSEKGWSQEALALESGVARSYLSGVERGKRNIALVNICKLADTLQVSAGEFFDFTTEVNRKAKRRG